MDNSFLFLNSEFIAEDGNEKFWQFLETVRELTVYKQGGKLNSMLALMHCLALYLAFKHQANTLTSFSQVKPNSCTIAC